MALLFVDSFDHYVTADQLKKWTSVGLGGGGAIVSGLGRCGSNCLQITSLGQVRKGVKVGGTAAIGYAGFAFKNTVNFSGVTFFEVHRETIEHWHAVLHTNGAIAIVNSADTQQAVSDPDIIRQGGWYFVEFSWTIHASAGAVTVKVNGVTVLTATGIDTWNSGAVSWNTIALASLANATNFFDDLYILDDLDDGGTPALNTFLGDVRVEYLRPTAEGSATDWTVVGGGTHANAVDKDDDSDDTSPSIQSDTLNDVDLNAYDDPTITSGTAFGVQVNILAEKAESGIRTIAPVVRHSSTNYVGDNVSPSQDALSYAIQTYGRNPGTSAGWTIADIAAAEFGVKVTL